MHLESTSWISCTQKAKVKPGKGLGRGALETSVVLVCKDTNLSYLLWGLLVIFIHLISSCFILVGWIQRLSWEYWEGYRNTVPGSDARTSFAHGFAIKDSHKSTWMFLGGWRKPENPEKAHTDMRRTCKSSTQAVSRGEGWTRDPEAVRYYDHCDIIPFINGPFINGP